MSSNWPKPAHNYVPEYQQSGIPYVTSSAANEVGATAIQVTFPYVTRWVQVFNTDGVVGDTMRVGFTQNGVKATETANYFILSGGQSTDRLELKCTGLWFLKHSANSASFSVVAGLTNVPAAGFPILSGSNEVAGVG
jgi:hypothetical protein